MDKLGLAKGRMWKKKISPPQQQRANLYFNSKREKNIKEGPEKKMTLLEFAQMSDEKEVGKKRGNRRATCGEVLARIEKKLGKERLGFNQGGRNAEMKTRKRSDASSRDSLPKGTGKIKGFYFFTSLASTLPRRQLVSTSEGPPPGRTQKLGKGHVPPNKRFLSIWERLIKGIRGGGGGGRKERTSRWKDGKEERHHRGRRFFEEALP